MGYEDCVVVVDGRTIPSGDEKARAKGPNEDGAYAIEIDHHDEAPYYARRFQALVNGETMQLRLVGIIGNRTYRFVAAPVIETKETEHDDGNGESEEDI